MVQQIRLTLYRKSDSPLRREMSDTDLQTESIILGILSISSKGRYSIKQCYLLSSLLYCLLSLTQRTCTFLAHTHAVKARWLTLKEDTAQHGSLSGMSERNRLFTNYEPTPCCPVWGGQSLMKPWEIPTGRDHGDSTAPSQSCSVDSKQLENIFFHNSCFIKTNRLNVRFTDIHDHLNYTWEMLAASELSVTCFTEEKLTTFKKETFSRIKMPFKLELHVLKKTWVYMFRINLSWQKMNQSF